MATEMIFIPVQTKRNIEAPRGMIHLGAFLIRWFDNNLKAFNSSIIVAVYKT